MPLSSIPSCLHLFFMQEEYSDSDNVSWFKRDLEFLFKHGVHAFYTYPEKTLKELEANASSKKTEEEKEDVLSKIK